MPSIISLLIALVVAVVVLWFLSMAIPGGIAALIALVVFLALAFSGAGDRLGFGGGRAHTGTRY